MSPNDLKEDPRQWLNIPHELHESLLQLMNMMYDGGFDLTGVHCLECEGREPFEVFVKATGESKLCTGYVDDPYETMLNLKE